MPILPVFLSLMRFVLWLGMVTTLLLGGCSLSPTYAPEKLTVPLFTQQGEWLVSLSQNVSSSYNFNINYALTEQYFIATKYSTTNLNNCRTCIIDVRRYGELSIGQFRVTNKCDSHRCFFRSNATIIGLGYGQSKSRQPDDWLFFDIDESPLAKASYIRPYIQYNVGGKNRYFETAFSLRASLVKNFSYVEWDNDDNPLATPGRSWGIFLEPGITLRLGYKAVKVETQLGVSKALIENREFNYVPFWLSVGIIVRTKLFE